MENLETFLELFGVPFVTGGPMTIGNPLSYKQCAELATQLPHASLQTEKIDQARTEILRGVVVDPPIMLMTAADVHLLCAIYNVLVTSHPLADSWPVTERHRKRMLRHAARMCHLPSDWTRMRALGRYALLHNIWSVFRKDVKLSWWTGKDEFLGQDAPKRLYRMSGLRRVKEEVEYTKADVLLLGKEQQTVVHSILSQAPLVTLLAPGTGPIDWSRSLPALRDKEISRAIVSKIFATKGDGESWNPASLAAFTFGLIQLLESSPKTNEVEIVVSFLVYCAGAIAAEEARKGYGKTPVSWPAVQNEKLDPLAPFFGLPNAMRKLEPELSLPPGIVEDPAMKERWLIHRRFIAERDPGIIDFWHTLLSKYFKPEVARTA